MSSAKWGPFWVGPNELINHKKAQQGKTMCIYIGVYSWCESVNIDLDRGLLKTSRCLIPFYNYDPGKSIWE